MYKIRTWLFAGSTADRTPHSYYAPPESLACFRRACSLGGLRVVNPWREQLDRARGRLYHFRFKGD